MNREEAIPVKKNKTYYIKLPDVFVQVEYKMHFYVYPDKIKSLENGKNYMSMGEGKYVYYPFSVSKKCLGSFVVSPMYWGDSSIRFTIQKKISGKWKNIIDTRFMQIRMVKVLSNIRESDISLKTMELTTSKSARQTKKPTVHIRLE